MTSEARTGRANQRKAKPTPDNVISHDDRIRRLPLLAKHSGEAIVKCTSGLALPSSGAEHEWYKHRMFDVPLMLLVVSAFLTFMLGIMLSGIFFTQ